jgi:hypothetical protein
MRPNAPARWTSRSSSRTTRTNPALLDVLERAQRTAVIDGADAALLIEVMLAERAAITSRVGLCGSGRTRRCEWAGVGSGRDRGGPLTNGRAGATV